METFKIVRIVYFCVAIPITIALLIVMLILSGDPNKICHTEVGTFRCQNAISDFMHMKLSLKWNTLKKELEKANPRRASVEHPPIAVYSNRSIGDISNESSSVGHLPIAAYYHRSVGDISNKSCLNHVTLKGWLRKDIIDTGITLYDGRALVLFGGHYFVYSFLELFEELGPNGESIDDCDIEHSIYKYNIIEGEEKRLISSLQPHQVPYGRRFNIYSSFVCLLVELRAGDEISVKVNYPRFIQNNDFNMFGLMMV